MKFCPTCETRYDEEILHFCTKDGTPLVDESQPSFTEMPSESRAVPETDLGEDTVVRYKPPKDILEPEPPPDLDRSEAPRIVIPMNEQKKEQQNVRARHIPPYQPLPPKSNTGKTVALTILGTLTILAFGLGLFWLLRSDDSSNKNTLNVNTNPPDMNLNTNLNIGGVNIPTPTNLNSNTNFNIDFNTNVNANLKTPSPSPTPKPSPSPSPTNADVNANVANIITNSAPPPTPKSSVTPPTQPGATPKITPTPDRTGRPSVNSNLRQ